MLRWLKLRRRKRKLRRMANKLLIGVGGVLTDRQEKIIKDKISKSVPDVEVVVVPFMNGSYMIEDKPKVVKK